MSGRVMAGRVDHKWLAWFPHAGWDLDFWLTVAKAVRKRGVRRGDRSGVVRICREVYKRKQLNTHNCRRTHHV